MSPGVGVGDRDPAPDHGPGPEGFIQFFAAFARPPNLAFDVEHLTADERWASSDQHGIREQIGEPVLAAS